MYSFSSWFIPAIGSSRIRKLRLGDQRARQLDALLQADRNPVDQLVAHALQLQEVDHLLDRGAVSVSSLRRKPASKAPCAARSGCMWTWRPSRMLSSTLMPLNSARFWNVRATPRRADRVRRHAGDVAAVEQDVAPLRRIKAGDRVGERRLAAAVRADEAEDLAALDPHVDAVQRDDATKAPLNGSTFEHRPGAFTSKNQPVSSTCRHCWLSAIRKAGHFFLLIDIQS